MKSHFILIILISFICCSTKKEKHEKTNIAKDELECAVKIQRCSVDTSQEIPTLNIDWVNQSDSILNIVIFNVSYFDIKWKIVYKYDNEFAPESESLLIDKISVSPGETISTKVQLVNFQKARNVKCKVENAYFKNSQVFTNVGGACDIIVEGVSE